ncbi:MAG: SAM-dependent methyltransferase [Phycisphaerales bacterium]|nr:SAM-dependent methyltransferase [Phycisphaerales bacterium]
MSAESTRFVSRGGNKLDHALQAFGIDVRGWRCADLGCSTGGFTDCLLRRGALRVYAVDTGYGVLDWRLRTDARVVVMERTNAMHVVLPEPVELVVVDAGWTRQKHLLPRATALLAAGGSIVSLVKPHYEADRTKLRAGVLAEGAIDAVLAKVRNDVHACGLRILAETVSPIRGRGGNSEFLWWLAPESGGEGNVGHAAGRAAEQG